MIESLKENNIIEKTKSIMI